VDDVFKTKAGDEILTLRGKIDRIDIDHQTKTFRVIDYKTGSTFPSEREVMAGKSFQLTLYGIVVEAIFLNGYWAKDAYFYNVKKSEKKRAFEMKTESDWTALKKITLQEVSTLLKKMKSYDFFGTPDTCFTSCELKAVCETEKAR